MPKSSLRFQFVLSYAILCILVFVLLNTYGRTTIYNHLIKTEETKLYNEAELIVKDYIPSMDILNTSDATLLKHFSSLQTLTNMRVWLASSDGMILIDSDMKNSQKGRNINRYDSGFLSNQTIVGRCPKGLLSESMITVIYPITESLETKGYVILMSPNSGMLDQATQYIDTILICFILLLAVTALIFFYLYHKSVRPLRLMTNAAKKYADGQFDEGITTSFSKEQNELASAIYYLSERMHSITDYQTKFIANVSHDFRSPLTSIKGYAEAIADGTIPPEMQQKYFNIILFEVERLTKLTGNLLELNQFEQDGLVLELADFDINQAIKDSSAAFEQRCTEKKISLNLIFSDKELFVNADINKIQQVIQNLLDNAIKFSPNDTTIEIRTAKRNHKVFISVKDHGIGIAKESQKKIWTRFYKTDDSRGKDKTGTGLGLSITKEIIEAHNENINVISTEGVGTEFIFTLPPAKKDEKNI